MRSQSQTRLKRLNMHAYIGEGNGNPLQYFCLENPVDRGAWWAAVHGVAQSPTLLKQLSMPAYIGEGNGNPLQCSCLENPRDGKPGWLPSMGSRPWAGKISWSRKWQPTPVFLPGKLHGQRNLVGNSAWGRKESDRTE